ncbi:MAG: hypothetical protein DSZ23_00920 [Thermodesulfatator sp.]|nr:MAG: hypothetical protein DSZ23_00920 [Thermodesulfatator sp.]
MKKAALIVSVIFGMAMFICSPVLASDEGLMSGMKGIAKEHAKSMVNEGVEKAGETANKKIDEVAGDTAAPSSETVDKAMETKEKAEEMKGNATSEVEAVKGDVEKHKKAVEGLKDTGESLMHGGK